MKLRHFYLNLPFIIIFLICTFYPNTGNSESINITITGNVTDMDTGQPIPHVSVFLANTTIGNTSDSTGSYIINEVTAGIFTLVFQHVGYEVETHEIVVSKNKKLSYDVKLSAKIFSGETIEIVADDPKIWQQRLNIFKNEFLGETENAYECNILNPLTLNFDFDEQTDLLSASSDSILIIENLALGYRIDIILKYFSCKLNGEWCEYLVFTKYDDFDSNDKELNSIWQKARKDCFEGSLRHFLSVLTTKNSDEYFQLHQGTKGSLMQGFGKYISAEKISLIPDINSPFLQLSFDEAIQITFHTPRSDNQSILELTDNYALIDSLGNLLSPLSMTIHGSWGSKRIGDTLPFDYNPE